MLRLSLQRVLGQGSLGRVNMLRSGLHSEALIIMWKCTKCGLHDDQYFGGWLNLQASIGSNTETIVTGQCQNLCLTAGIGYKP